MRGLSGLSLVVIGLGSPSVSLAQSLEYYISKQALDCIAENRQVYEATATYDFAIVFPALCPDVPGDQGTTVGNEYLRLPEPGDGPPVQAEVILVPLTRFECLQRLSGDTGGRPPDDLLRVDLDACSSD